MHISSFNHDSKAEMLLLHLVSMKKNINGNFIYVYEFQIKYLFVYLELFDWYWIDIGE